MRYFVNIYNQFILVRLKKAFLPSDIESYIKFSLVKVIELIQIHKRDNNINDLLK